MSQINTDDIWLALGDFYHMFPEDERVYWSTFWEAWSDITADLWGYAFQVDRAKSLFSTTATMERRETLVQFSNLVQSSDAQFQISSLKQDASGRWILRGFVPRESRDFSTLPDQGLIRIGVDLIPYIQVNTTTITGGVFNGFVREATFVLDEEPPHNYNDDPEFNDDFARDQASLKFRINQIAGETIVDAVLVNSTDTVIVNPQGLLTLGTPGINAEIVEYESVVILGDRYVFTLSSSWQTPDTGVENLDFDHFIDEPLSVDRYDSNRWSQTSTGNTRIVSAGDMRVTIDQAPVPVAALAQVIGKYSLQENVDFDVSVVVDLEVWDGTMPVSTNKSAYARLSLGAVKYVLGIKRSRTGAGDFEAHAISGVEGSETETLIGTSLAIYEARFKRIAGVLEFQFRPINDEEFTVLEKISVTGERASLDLIVNDPNTQSPSRVRFDEVIRRSGGIVGNTRLEEFFTATETYPYTYDIDQNITQALELRDRPRLRVEFMSTVEDINEPDAGTVRARAGADFEANGVPESGVLEIQGTQIIYDSFTRDGDVFEFTTRGELDPDIIPLPAGTFLTANTRSLQENFDFTLSGSGQISLKELPTRDRMWAPVSQIDIRHIQNHYGVLTDLDAVVSNDAYLNRVQGTWFALMSGPSIRNVESGLQLAMGLPVAKTTGTITSIKDVFDDLGRFISRTLTVLSEDGSFDHGLNPDLFPFIDWSFVVGQTVDQFQPLSNGVEVLDVVKDNDWHLRFPGVSDIERFNSFGVFVAIEALSADASVDDAIRFALRIKPTYTKMFMRFLLTSGDEDLSEDLDDDVFAVIIPSVFEDMSFDEGLPPEAPGETRRLGEGHKLGQGKKLGAFGFWKPEKLGTYARQGPFAGDGIISAGSNVFTGAGGYGFVEVDATADGSVTAGSDLFDTGGAYAFVDPADVGKKLVVLDSLDDDDNDAFEILEVLSATQVRLNHVFGLTSPALDWRLQAPGFTAQDIGKNIHITGAIDPADNGDHKISGLVSQNQIQVLHTFANNEQDLDWELRSYLQLGAGNTLGELRYFQTPVEGSRLPSEEVDAQQVVTVASPP